MKGKWDPWYSTASDNPKALYFDSPTFKLGADWLKDCSLVEDWGCGLGWMKTYIPDRYRGLDGTDSPNCDEVVDLRLYHSQVPGIFMRGVLEHNLEWPRVLKNFLKSFSSRAALVLFTPMSEGPTHQIAWVPKIEVPDMSFNHEELISYFPENVTWEFQDLSGSSIYNVERIYFLERNVPLV